jgi:transcriptional regulator with XRE-family HTH domain
MTRTASAKPRAARPYGRGSGVPNPIDVHVGRRIRLRRRLLGMNQTALSDALDLTFQQVQKYENGGNRVSASRLSEIAAFLGVPVSFFFINLPGGTATPEERTSRERMEQSETIELVRHYYALPDPEMRQKFLAMVKAAAGAGKLV